MVMEFESHQILGFCTPLIAFLTFDVRYKKYPLAVLPDTTQAFLITGRVTKLFREPITLNPNGKSKENSKWYCRPDRALQGF